MSASTQYEPNPDHIGQKSLQGPEPIATHVCIPDIGV